jgi:hypothetical protein
MKLIITLLLLTSPIHAVTPLDMKLGYWEYKIDLGTNPMMKKAMASLSKLPKAQRDQVIKSMGMSTSGIKKTYICFTSKDMKNWEEKISGIMDKDGCKMIVKKSTKKIYEAVRKCKDEQGNMEFSFKMLSNKEGSSSVIMSMSPKPINTKMSWVSSKCPKKKK